MRTKNDPLPPRRWITEIQREIPSVWSDVQILREEKNKGLRDWPDWCYLPASAGAVILSKRTKNKTQAARLTNAGIMPSLIIGAAAWRVSQGIYQFDADLHHELISQPLEGNLPCDVLFHLPEWCVYIATPGQRYMDTSMAGFWAWLEYNDDTHSKTLRLQLFFNDYTLPVLLYLGNWTLGEALRLMGEIVTHNATDISYILSVPAMAVIESARQIAPLVQLVLYLCASNADLPLKPVHPAKEREQSDQNTIILSPRTWGVGIRTGTALRAYRNPTGPNGRITRDSPRPHIRPARWNHFWKEQDLQKELVLKWVPPIPMEPEDPLL